LSGHRIAQNLPCQKASALSAAKAKAVAAASSNSNSNGSSTSQRQHWHQAEVSEDWHPEKWCQEMSW
jgi:hypothetical protein